MKINYCEKKEKNKTNLYDLPAGSVIKLDSELLLLVRRYIHRYLVNLKTGELDYLSQHGPHAPRTDYTLYPNAELNCGEPA